MLKKKSTFDTVKITDLRWVCDHDTVDVPRMKKPVACPDIIGQRRGVDALKLGFDIESEGYNLFVSGMVGTGRKTSIKCLLKETERVKRIPDDKLYVNNFRQPDKPRLIRLPAGEGRRFKKNMEELIDYLQATLPELFESEDYRERKREIVEEIKKKQKELISRLEKEVNDENFSIIQMQIGMVTKPAILPIRNEKPVGFDQLHKMVEEGEISPDEMRKIEEKHAELTEKLNAILQELRGLEKESEEKLRKLNHEMVTPLIEVRIREIKEQYSCEAVDHYLDEVNEHLLEHLPRFLKPEDDAKRKLVSRTKPMEDPFQEYQVNVLVDNCDAEQAPVVYETSPTYNNLFGTVEVIPGKFGISKTDFTKIKAGSILQADGGFLIVEALDLLIEPGVWPAFKRMLRNGKLEILPLATMYGIAVSGMKPESIDIDIKVAMVGDPYLYHLLYTRDEDFKKIFKLRADFDSVMDISPESMKDYANFVRRIEAKEKLTEFESEAIAAVVEHGVRVAGKKGKLSTRFNHIADVLREADYWAGQANRKKVRKEDVLRAIEERMNRSRLIDEKIQEMIDEGSIMIDTEGQEIGQVNGLSVYDTGDYAFGKPSRITAVVSVGETGILNIEREAELSGRIHNKGVLILGGYLRSKFAQDKPLSISASLCFEQSYGGVEGDSASSTEVYALLSALSDLPLRQDIAVTGSVNQKGEVQPIGGVNEKIEGFFRTCKNKGLTGTQGVMIPDQNVNQLMLHREILGAVENGQFAIYPVETVEQGIEILTGVEAGTRREDGSYEEGTVNFLVDRRLQKFADIWKQYSVG